MLDFQHDIVYTFLVVKTSDLVSRDHMGRNASLLTRACRNFVSNGASFEGDNTITWQT